MTRRLPLQKLFPGKVVARIKIWFSTYSIGIVGPIPPELARLIVAVTCNRDPVALAKIDAIADELNDKTAKPARSDRAIRQEISKKRRQGKIG